MVITQIERQLPDCELQLVERADGSRYFEFYAVRWYDPRDPGTEYQLPNGRVERVERHAFDDVLSSDDVSFRWNHSRDFELGTKETGLILRTDEFGLRGIHPYDGEDPDHQKVRAKIVKKLARGGSFKARAMLRFADEGGKHVQYVSKILSLEDVSIVDKPAYKGTAAIVRSENEEEIERSYQEWCEQQKQDAALLEKLDNLIREK
jgi:HK97 family phage prohead protease